jgi:hypothetical protein
MLTNDFYIVDLEETNVLLGVQWLYSLEYFSMNYQIMKMYFKDIGGQRVVPRGMSHEIL